MTYFLLLDENFNIIERAIGELINESYVEVSQDEFADSQFHLKFNPETREFSEPIEVKEIEVTETEHEKLTRETYETTSTSADDTLLNMDLLTAIDDKLNLIMEHLGLC